MRRLFNPYLKECLFLELCINNKKGYVISLHRSPNETADEFDSFIINLKKLVANISNRNPHFVLISGNFSFKSTNWSSYGTTTSEGAQLDSLMTLHGLKQLITEPTHILENSSSCIDLVSTNPPNTAVVSGIHPTLHSNCYRQIIYSKVNLKKLFGRSIFS